MEDLQLGLGGTADNHDVGSRDDILGLAGDLVDAAGKVTLALPAARLSEGLDLGLPDLRASGK